MSKVKKDKRMSKVVSKKSRKSKGKEVAFKCECCDEPVTVDELYTGHVTQVIDRFLKTQSKIKVKEWNPECLQIEFFGKRFDVMVFDLEEEARNEVSESRRS